MVTANVHDPIAESFGLELRGREVMVLPFGLVDIFFRGSDIWGRATGEPLGR